MFELRAEKCCQVHGRSYFTESNQTNVPWKLYVPWLTTHNQQLHTSSTNSKIIVNIYMSCSLLLLSDKLPLSPHTKTVEYTVGFCKQTHRQCCRWRHCFCSSVVSGRKRKQFVFQFFNMVVATMPKRVRAARPDFVSLSASTESLKQRKRVNKNKKKNWNKHSDINDIEKYLDDVRHEQRTTG